MYPQCEFFAQQGMHCFAAQYRLGKNNIPLVREAISDVQDALNFLSESAESLGLGLGAETSAEPGAPNIVVAGSSAGGHLAAALGAALPSHAGDRKKPAALVLYNPMVDLSPGTPDYHLVKDYWEDVSPYHHVTTEFPPTLFLVGTQDPEVPVPTAQAFCERLSAKGARCDLELYEGRSHGFFHHRGGDNSDFSATNTRILDFLSSQGLLEN